MRFIPTRAHGLLDYLMGMLLIAAPFLLNFDRGGAETWVPVVLGAGVLVYSVFTNYEFGAFKILSMPAHLMLDFLGGLFLAASPWIFGFADYVYLPHLILGIAEMGAALMTKKVPHHGAATNDRRHSRYEHAHLKKGRLPFFLCCYFMKLTTASRGPS
ncbi:MAG: hypothetical protein EOP49_00150 [Sphingobacteriales bacterium]|nr:MAG: hypothetical protein EOP49_00150 [Sphingobacteriales bacterium]